MNQQLASLGVELGWAGLGWRLPWRGSSVRHRQVHPSAGSQELMTCNMLGGRLRPEMNISGTTTLSEQITSAIIGINKQNVPQAEAACL